MYSLIYIPDVEEYCICNSRNVIQEDDGICIVAFRGQVINTSGSKDDLQVIHENEVYVDGSTEVQNVSNTASAPLTSVEEFMEDDDLNYNGDEESEVSLTMTTKIEFEDEAVSEGQSISQERALHIPLYEKVPERLKRMVSPNFEEEDALEALEGDVLAVLFHNSQAMQGRVTEDITVDLQILGRILIEMRRRENNITNLASIFAPQHFENIRKCLCETSLMNTNTKDLIFNCGKLLYNFLNTNGNNEEEKHDIVVFLSMLNHTNTIHRPMKIEKGAIKQENQHQERIQIDIDDATTEQCSRLEENLNRTMNVTHPNTQQTDEEMEHYFLRQRTIQNNQQADEELQRYYLRQRTILSSKSRAVANSKKVRKVCRFCQRSFDNITLHIRKMHGNKQQVIQLASCTKDSSDGNRFTKALVNRGTESDRNDYNTSDKPSELLEKNILKKLVRDDITKIIKEDKLIVEFSCVESKLCNDESTVCERLRVLGRVLYQLRRQNAEITDLTSIFSPRHIEAVKSISSSLYARARALLVQCGQILLRKNDNVGQKKNVIDFLNVLPRNVILNETKS